MPTFQGINQWKCWNAIVTPLNTHWEFQDGFKLEREEKACGLGGNQFFCHGWWFSMESLKAIEERRVWDLDWVPNVLFSPLLRQVYKPLRSLLYMCKFHWLQFPFWRWDRGHVRLGGICPTPSLSPHLTVSISVVWSDYMMPDNLKTLNYMQLPLNINIFYMLQ